MCDDTLIGSANHQIDSVIEALKHGGLHPKCPLPRVSRSVVRDADHRGAVTVEYRVPPTHREVRAFRFVALADAPSVDVFELDYQESLNAEHAALRVCFVSSNAVGTLQGRRRDEWEVWRGYAESLVGPGHQVTMLFTDTASFKDAAAVEWLQTEVASIGATLELLEERTPSGHRISTAPQLQEFREAVWTLEWFKSMPAFDVAHVSVRHSAMYFTMQERHLARNFGSTLFVAHPLDLTPQALLRAGAFMHCTRDIMLTFLERRAMALADVVVFPTPFAERVVSDLGWDIPDKRLLVMPFPLAGRQVFADATASQPPGTPTDDANPIGAPAPPPVPATPLRVTEFVFVDATHITSAADADMFVMALGALTVDVSVTIFGIANQVGRAVQQLPHVHSQGRHLRSGGRALLRKALVYCEADPSRVLVGVDYHGMLMPLLNRVLMAPKHISFLASTAAAPLFAPQHASEILFKWDPGSIAELMARTLKFGYNVTRPLPRYAASASVREWATLHVDAKATAVLQARTPVSLDKYPPLVSVCIPTFNRADVLRATLQTLMEQSYTNMEVVIADDDSTEPDAVEYLRHLNTTRSLRFPVRVYMSPGTGATAARNAAAAAAQGEYVLFFDNDDLAMPDMVEVLVQAAETTGADVVGGWAQVFDNPKAFQGTGVSPDATSNLWVPCGASAEVGLHANAFLAAPGLHRRDKFIGYRGGNSLKHLDYNLYAREVVAGLHMEVVPRPLYHYRKHSKGSIFGSKYTYHAQWHSLDPFLQELPEYARLAVQRSFSLKDPDSCLQDSY